MNQFGLNVEFSEHSYSNTTGYGATAKEKASDLNECFANPKYKAILMGDNYVNQIDFGIFDKKNNLKDNLFKFPLIKRKVEGSDDFSNSDSKSEKDENHDNKFYIFN